MAGYDFPDLGKLFIFLIVMVCLLVPLAAWKIVDIITWLTNNMTITWSV